MSDKPWAETRSGFVIAAQRPRGWLRFWPSLLAAGYLLIFLFGEGLENRDAIVPLWIGSALACLLVQVARLRAAPESQRIAARGAVGALRSALLWPWERGLEALRRVPGVILWLPLPVSMAWIAAAMARVNPAEEPDYYAASWLWAAALALFIGLFVVPIAADGWRKLPALAQSVPWLEVAAVASITAVAFAVRLIDLANEPSPFWSDEGYTALRGVEVLDGAKENLFDMGFGILQPALYYGVLAVSFKIFGVGVVAARLPHALFAAATVPLFYLLLRELFDRRVAVTGAAFLAVYHFHLHYSRLALPNVLDALFAVAILYWALRAVRTGQLLDFAMTGLLTGLLFYFFSAARVVPMVLVLLFVLMMLRTRGMFLLRNFWGLGALAAGLAVSVLPAALYYQDFPDHFTLRWEEQNIFDTGWLDAELERTGHSEVHIVWDQLQRSLGVFLVYKDEISHYNPGVPLLSAVAAVLFVIGGVYAVFHLFQPRYFVLLALLLLTAVFAGALLIPVPQIGTQRFLSAAPASAALVAVGLVILSDAWAKLVPRWRLYSPAVIVLGLSLLALMDLSFYFGTYLPSDNFGNANAQGKAQIADYLDRFDDSYAVYALEVPGFNLRESALNFRARDKVVTELSQDDGLFATYIEGFGVRADAEEAVQARRSKPNALFLVPVGRQEDFNRIRSLCPNGSTSSEFADPVGNFPYRWYELQSASACLNALQRDGIFKSGPDQ